MMAIRGGLAIAFGLAVLLWPNGNLPIVVVLFGAYALTDGVWAMVAAVWTGGRSMEAWPVALEGLVSAGLGALALARPFVPREFILVVAWWGLLTGVVEIVTALRLPRVTASHWLFGTGGASSLFLAILIVLLPHADLARIIGLIGIYALVFGALMLLAAIGFKRHAPTN
jgi:uncharacterized membrane protein HdeD (DUF308 family)